MIRDDDFDRSELRPERFLGAQFFFLWISFGLSEQPADFSVFVYVDPFCRR